MYFTVESAFRLDSNHLKMSNLRIETYDENQTPQMMIDSSESILDLGTRILTSSRPVTIRRSDFEITGQTMAFDTNTRHGTFTGHVHMLIFNRESLQQSTKGATANE
jgi:LPS export ABC transporter protein LptC